MCLSPWRPSRRHAADAGLQQHSVAGHGQPIITPSQDMVLGCYYLTAENPGATKGAGHYFASMEDAIMAFEQDLVALHAKVWLRFDGEVESDQPKDGGPGAHGS
jgi:DNA-directed RNA polymerase beta' subunit